MRACGQYITTEEIKRNLFICPVAIIITLSVEDRMLSIVDEGSLKNSTSSGIEKSLDFDGFTQKLTNAQKKTAGMKPLFPGREPSRVSGDSERARFFLHGRQHGIGGRRKNHPGGGALSKRRDSVGDYFHWGRRCAHA
jgi:hypothetical protein